MIPSSFTYEATFVPDGGDPIVLESSTTARRNRPSGNHPSGECTFTESVIVDDPSEFDSTGILYFTGTVLVMQVGH